MLQLKQCEDYNLRGYGDDIKIKKYLSTEEIAVIVNNALEVGDLVLRDKLINLYILTFCTNIQKEEIDELDYNLAISSGLINEVNLLVVNRCDVYKYIEAYESVNKIIDGMCMEILKRVPKDLDKFVSKNITKIKKMIKNDK